MTSIPVIPSALAFAAAVCLGAQSGAQTTASGQSIDVPLTPARWSIQSDLPRTPDDTARYESHLGHASLLLPGGFAWAKGVELRNGTIEADVATAPKGAFFGLAFHVTSPDQFENVFFRPRSSGSVQYSPSWFNMNAWQFYPGAEYTADPDFRLTGGYTYGSPSRGCRRLSTSTPRPCR